MKHLDNDKGTFHANISKAYFFSLRLNTKNIIHTNACSIFSCITLSEVTFDILRVAAAAVKWHQCIKWQLKKLCLMKCTSKWFHTFRSGMKPPLTPAHRHTLRSPTPLLTETLLHLTGHILNITSLVNTCSGPFLAPKLACIKTHTNKRVYNMKERDTEFLCFRIIWGTKVECSFPKHTRNYN